MKHKLSLKAAAAYGYLLACVPEYARINFDDVFENFLNAYDADNKPDKTQTVQNFQRDIPKVGEVYKDLFGHRFQIVGVFNEPCVATQTIGDNPLNEQIFQFASLKRFKFSDLTKED